METFYGLKDKLLEFLQRMKGKNGFYKYSLSGDLYDENIHWGLGNTIFALKLYYLIDSLEKADLDEIYDFVISFQKPKGYLYDDYLHKKSFSLGRIFLLMKKLQIRKLLFRKNEKRAESRQSFAGLFIIDKKPPIPFSHFPKSEKSIEKYLSSLNWNRPWDAGSHFSHLIFFLFNMRKYYPKNFGYDANELISYAFEWVNKIRKDDGSWYIGNATLNQKINGAMKIITGLNVIGKPINDPEKLIDLCVDAINDKHACNNYDIVHVLYNCSKQLNYSYRQDEIDRFLVDRLKKYEQHYYEDIGGFSFFPKKSNIHYYGVRVTKGLNEPDIHGTLLFTSGISKISEVLGFNKEIGLKTSYH